MPTTKYATPEMLAKLAAPTPREEIKTKPGRGGSGDLSFIDARFVFDRFDSALGPHLWQVQISWTPPVHTPERKSRNDRVIEPEWTSSYPMAGIGVLCAPTEPNVRWQGWVWKQDIGVFSDIEGVKGSVSDSIKRAAVQWGVGRDLYDPDSEARSTNTPRSTKAEQAGEVERSVVGQKGLTDHDRRKLFAALGEAGMTGDKRKAFVFLAVQKHSVKDMTSDDLDAVLAILKAPQSEHPEVWENVAMVSGD